MPKQNYGISTWITRDVPMQATLAALADTGFAFLELSAEEGELVQEWERDPRKTASLLAGVGLPATSVHCPVNGRFLDDPDTERRSMSVAENMRYFELMARSAIDLIVIHPTGSGDYSTEEICSQRRKWSVESLTILAHRAGEMGLRMAVENLGRPPRPAATIEDILAMISGLGEHVGVCHDIGHSQQAHLDVCAETRTAAQSGKLMELHIHDVDLDGKDHYVPGEGCLEYAPLLVEWDAAIGNHRRVLEVSPPPEAPLRRLRKADAVQGEWQDT